jgi:transketolase
VSDVSTGPDRLEWTDEDQRVVDTVRVLAMDAVEKCGSGHPGTAMALAPAAYLLFQKLMRHNPADPNWAGRDRFVLSAGHSSLTLYIQLFLAGYGLEIEDLEALRTWGSRTPGHPEHGHTPGVETTTGPLGQGVGNAVGMAMAARRAGCSTPTRPRARARSTTTSTWSPATATWRRAWHRSPRRWRATSGSATSR